MEVDEWRKIHTGEVARRLYGERVLLADFADAVGCFAQAQPSLQEAVKFLDRAIAEIKESLANWDDEAPNE